MRHVAVFAALSGAVLPPSSASAAEPAPRLAVHQYVILVTDTPVKGRLPGGSALIPRGTEVKIDRVEGDRVVVRDGWKSAWVRREDVVTRGDAVEYFTEAIRRDPTAADYRSRAARWFFEDEHARAIADLEEAIRLDPAVPGPYFARGRDRLAKGDRAGALADFEHVIRLDPTSGHAYFERGDMRRREGDWTAAAADFEEAVRVMPSQMRFKDRLGWLLATCPEDRLRDGPRALRLALDAWAGTGWERADYATTAAAAWAETGDFGRAAAIVQTARLLDPGGEEDGLRAKMLAAFERRQPWREPPAESLRVPAEARRPRR